MAISKAKFLLSFFLTIIFSTISGQNPISKIEVSGEFKKWHTVTLTFDGPSTDENHQFNPFLHYRLDVSFTNGEKLYRVPGYYAADGNAGQSSATGGNKWRVHFTPDKEGEWTYRISFRKGNNVAISDALLAGTSGGYADGLKGNFTIQSTDKGGKDFRSKGRLSFVNKPFLQFEETGEFFIKAGVDAPENLFAYVDFDGNFKTDGFKDNLVKTWEPHLKDWNEGDPTWGNGKGKALIGGINYLASKGLNAMSFLTLNIIGDDQNVFPYLTYDAYDRIDVSRMDQWNIVMTHAQHNGIFLHFKTSEAENQGLLDGGELGIERKLYYRELIARFGHHLALNWNMGEENGKWMENHPSPYQTTTQRLAMAQYFYENDPYRHHIVIHNGQQYYDLLGPESKYSGLSLQTNRVDFKNVRPFVLKWRKLAKENHKMWANAVDEPGDHRFSLVPDSVDPNHDNARQNALWGALTAGAWGIEWYFGYSHPHSDLTCEDWRSRDNMWNQCKYALDFFKTMKVPLWIMEPNDARTKSSNDFVMEIPGNLYLLYLKMGDKKGSIISDITGEFLVTWFHPKTGQYSLKSKKTSVNGSLDLSNPPSNPDDDWVVYVQKVFTPIFNGKDFSGWNIYLRDRPLNQDPNNVFSVQNNGSIFVQGKEFGYMLTKNSYENFHLKLEYKWGDNQYAPRENLPRDAGILYYVDAKTSPKIWPKAIECQVQQGDMGDFWLIDSTTIIVERYRTKPKNYNRVKKTFDAEKEHGTWNTVEVIAVDGHLYHLVNGVLVNEGKNASLRKGHILLQSEGCDLWYRNIEIKRL